MRALLLLLAVPLWAADDVNSIIRRLIEADRRNEKTAQQYTYTETREQFSIDKDGQTHSTNSSRWEVIFVEGLAYTKLVERNGKPLSPREQAQVDKQMRQTADYRRKHQRQPAEGGQITLRGLFMHKSADLGSFSELPTYFDNHLAGEDEIRGHKVWILESVPRSPGPQVTEHEKQIIGFRKKFWIDQKDAMAVRGAYTVEAENSILRRGSILTFDYEKVDAETWEPIQITLDFSTAKEKTYRPTGRTVYRMDNFKKFDVKSTITPIGPGK